MEKKTGRILFLCTGNSARSIMAEAILNRLGGGEFRGYSAGSHPKGEVHPMALALVHELGMPVQALRSKSWDEFARPGAPQMDYIITVCDSAAGEICPIWPGKPMTAHWGLPDPAAVKGPLAQQEAAFRGAFKILEARIRRFLSRAREAVSPADLKSVLTEIGKLAAESPS
jgi:arsenate reductase